MSKSSTNPEVKIPKGILKPEADRMPAEEKEFSQSYLDFLEGRGSTLKKIPKKKRAVSSQHADDNSISESGAERLQNEMLDSQDPPNDGSLAAGGVEGQNTQILIVLGDGEGLQSESNSSEPQETQPKVVQRSRAGVKTLTQQPTHGAHLGKRAQKHPDEPLAVGHPPAGKKQNQGGSKTNQKKTKKVETLQTIEMLEISAEDILRTTDAKNARMSGIADNNQMMEEARDFGDQQSVGSGESASQDDGKHRIEHPVLGSREFVPAGDFKAQNRSTKEDTGENTLLGFIDESDLLEMFVVSPGSSEEVKPIQEPKNKQRMRPKSNYSQRKSTAIIRTNLGFSNLGGEDQTGTEDDVPVLDESAIQANTGQVQANISKIGQFMMEEQDSDQEEVSVQDSGDEDALELVDGQNSSDQNDQTSSDHDKSESEDSSEGSESGNRAKKGRTREYRVGKIARTGKKKGRPYQTDASKIKQVLGDPKRERTVIVQAPVHFPVDSMNQLANLLKENIELVRSSQEESRFNLTRERTDSLIVTALLDVGTLKWKEKIMDYVSRNCSNREEIQAVKQRLSIFDRGLEKLDPHSEEAIWPNLQGQHADDSEDEFIPRTERQKFCLEIVKFLEQFHRPGVENPQLKPITPTVIDQVPNKPKKTPSKPKRKPVPATILVEPQQEEVMEKDDSQPKPSPDELQKLQTEVEKALAKDVLFPNAVLSTRADYQYEKPTDSLPEVGLKSTNKHNGLNGDHSYQKSHELHQSGMKRSTESAVSASTSRIGEVNGVISREAPRNLQKFVIESQSESGSKKSLPHDSSLLDAGTHTQNPPLPAQSHQRATSSNHVSGLIVLSVSDHGGTMMLLENSAEKEPQGTFNAKRNDHVEQIKVSPGVGPDSPMKPSIPTSTFETGTLEVSASVQGPTCPQQNQEVSEKPTPLVLSNSKQPSVAASSHSNSEQTSRNAVEPDPQQAGAGLAPRQHGLQLKLAPLGIDHKKSHRPSFIQGDVDIMEPTLPLTDYYGPQGPDFPS